MNTLCTHTHTCIIHQLGNIVFHNIIHVHCINNKNV